MTFKKGERLTKIFLKPLSNCSQKENRIILYYSEDLDLPEKGGQITFNTIVQDVSKRWT